MMMATGCYDIYDRRHIFQISFCDSLEVAEIWCKRSLTNIPTEKRECITKIAVFSVVCGDGYVTVDNVLWQEDLKHAFQ